MERKKEKKKNYEQQAPRRARVPVIDFCCLIAHTDSFILPYNSWQRGPRRKTNSETFILSSPRPLSGRNRADLMESFIVGPVCVTETKRWGNVRQARSPSQRWMGARQEMGRKLFSCGSPPSNFLLEIFCWFFCFLKGSISKYSRLYCPISCPKCKRVPLSISIINSTGGFESSLRPWNECSNGCRRRSTSLV